MKFNTTYFIIFLIALIIFSCMNSPLLEGLDSATPTLSAPNNSSSAYNSAINTGKSFENSVSNSLDSISNSNSNSNDTSLDQSTPVYNETDNSNTSPSHRRHHGRHHDQRAKHIPNIVPASHRRHEGVSRAQIPKGDEDLYILKSEIVPPVCPACPPVNCGSCKKDCRPCPPCARCPEPSFECKKVPNYSLGQANTYLPRPFLNDFSQFGS